MSRRAAWIAGVAAVFASFLLASSGSAAPARAARTLRVDVTEWAVVPSQGFVAAGPLRVTVVNAGVLRHELAILPTGWWGENVPVLNGRAAREHASPPIVVAPGESRSARVYLPAGTYLLVDDIRGHYALGAAASILAG
jgi:hypothetical protein